MRLLIALLLVALPVQAPAEAPKVVTSIRPVHDLVRVIMAGVGEPELLLKQNESVHHPTMRPSRMRSLAEADLVVWVGEGLEPWLTRGLAAVNRGTAKLELTKVEGIHLLEIRQPATLAPDADQALAALEKPDEPETEADADFFSGEENFLEADLEDQAANTADAADAERLLDLESPAEAGAEPLAEQDDHGSFHDPHIWLDPRNSALMLEAIAEALVQIDPDNADIYLANAEEARLDLGEALLAVRDQLVNLTDTRFIFNHDSFQYFEAAFGLKSIGTLSTTDAKQVGARTISGIQNDVEFAPVICLIIDRSESGRSARALFSGMTTIALDPMGSELEPGQNYPGSLFLGLAEGFASCD